MGGGFNLPGAAGGAHDSEATAYGSGFLVNPEGALVTNSHVVDGCKRIRVKVGDSYYPAGITQTRPAADLAILSAPALRGDQAVFRADADARLGEPVIAAGFPLPTTLARQINVTNGVVSSTAGIKGDPNQFQMSVPVQPGSSGGPVLDASGQVVGVTAAKLNAVAAYRSTGVLSENVNFAIKGAVIQALLRETETPFTVGGIEPETGSEAIARRAQGFTVSIECEK
jgi:S1-C subfamily serine protease